MATPITATKTPAMVSSPLCVVKSMAAWPCKSGEDQGADDQSDSDGHADAERHAEMAHGEAVADVSDAPHGSEEGNFQEQMRPHGGVKGWEIGQKNETDADGEQNPGEKSGDGPGGLPGPVLDFLDGRVKGSGHGRAEDVPPDSSEDCYGHSVSISCCGRDAG